MKQLVFLAVIVAVCVTKVACLSYDVGKLYSYNYVTEVHINEADPTNNDDVGFKLSSTVDLAVVWEGESEQVARMTIRDVRLANVTDRKDDENTFSAPPMGLKVASSQPVFFVWNSAGKVTQIYVGEEESEGSADVKRGVIGLLQMQDVVGEVAEEDASGECTVTYTKVDTKILKLKDLSSCRTVHSGGYSHAKEALGINIQSEASASSYMSADLKTIESAVSFEKWKTYVNIRSELSSSVTSSQSLALQNSDGTAQTLQGSTAEGAIASAGKFRQTSWNSDEMNQQCGKECRPLSEVVAEARNGLTDEAVAKTKSVMAYLDVLEAFRNSGKEAIIATIRDENNAPIIAQLFDILSATQTQPAWEAIKELVVFTSNEGSEAQERFLLTMANNNHPTKGQIAWLLALLRGDRVRNDGVKSMLALTTAKLVYFYCHQGTEQCNSKVVSEVMDWLHAGVKADNQMQKILCLNALKNAVRPGSIPTLLSVAHNDPDMDVVEMALDALLKFDPKYFTPEVNNILNTIYYEGDKSYSPVTRTLAATLLMSKQPSLCDINDIILSLKESSQPETAVFVLEKVLELAKESTQASETIQLALSDSRIQNYDTMALPGKSVAFKNLFLETDDISLNYGMDIQMTPSGLLRKSDFQVGLDVKNDSLLLLNVGIFSRGLEYFFGEESGDSGEATARMNIECLDMKLRTQVFFTGTGELMSLAWNMGSSDSMPHMRITELVQDHSQKLSLQSGFDVDVNVQGSLSLDLGGALEFSLWDRSSNTIVSTSGALGARGSTRIKTPFINTGIEYTGKGATTVNFVTSVQFSSLPPLSCLQLMSDPVIYINEIKKEEQLVGSETKYQSYLRRRFKVQDQSFRLSSKNSAPCREMFGQEEEEEEEGSWW